MVMGENDVKVLRAASNLPKLNTIPVEQLNTYDVVKNAVLVIAENAVDYLQKAYDFEEVDKVRLRKKVEKYIYNANPWVDCFDCEKEVEIVYNYHTILEDKQSIQHLVKEARMKRQLEINEDNRLRAFQRTKKGVQGFIDAQIEDDEVDADE